MEGMHKCDMLIPAHVTSGESGALGHGDASSSASPRLIEAFASKRVSQVFAGDVINKASDTTTISAAILEVLEHSNHQF